jgi:DNA-binding transcriptional regulator YdaS (Cro superfamily)
MTKTEAIRLAGSKMALARLLGISRQAIQLWPEKRIPPLRVYQLRELRPEWFVRKGRGHGR